MNCDQCKSDLFGFVEGTLNASRRGEIDDHLQGCEPCNRALADIWQMQMIASRWHDEQVPPHWKPRSLFFDTAPWLPRLQLATSVASIFLLVIVLADVRISTRDGIEVGAVRDYIDSAELTGEMSAFRQSQQADVQRRLDRFSSQQVATNQLLLRTILETSREERRDELAAVFALLDEQDDQRSRETRESLRYLIASQVEDKRDIERLDRALTQVSDPGNRF